MGNGIPLERKTENRFLLQAENRASRMRKVLNDKIKMLLCPRGKQGSSREKSAFFFSSASSAFVISCRSTTACSKQEAE